MPSRQKEIGRRVREARTRLELTQAELAERLELEDATVRAIEAGRRGLSVESLLRMADALGMRPGEIVDPEVAPVPKPQAEAGRLVAEMPSEWQQAALRILREIHRQIAPRRGRVANRR